MTMKSLDVVRKELSNSLSIIEHDIGQLATFDLAWQSIATQLYKVLCDGTPTFLERAIPNPLLHPMRTTITPNACLQHMGCQVEFKESGLTMSCFDETRAPMQLHLWCSQIILVSDSQDLAIRDVIRFPRVKEAAPTVLRRSAPRFSIMGVFAK